MSSSTFELRLATDPVVDCTLQQVAREGARRYLQKAIEDEVEQYINAYTHHLDDAGDRLVVRNGHHKPRTILSGLGPLEVKQPRVDDRRVDENGVWFRFASKYLPPYLRKTKAIEDLNSWLYLKGISTGETVLYVDDHLDTREIVGKILRQRGHRVVAVGDFANALATASPSF
jgi:hypothetical protein